MPKKGKTNKPRKECYTRDGKSGSYVVCNDPPRGSKGQKGVYKAENPTGKQDGRTARNKVKETEAIMERSKIKDRMKDKYPAGLPKGLPDYKKMVNDLVRNGDKREKYEKMGKAFAYDNWISTPQGKKWGKEYEDELIYYPRSLQPDLPRSISPAKDAPEKKTTHGIVPLVPYRRKDLIKGGVISGKKKNYAPKDTMKARVRKERAKRDLWDSR